MRDHADVSAEYSALRGLVEDSTLAHSTRMTTEMFSSVPRRLIFAAIQELSQKNLKIDPVTIMDRIDSQHQLACQETLAEAISGPGVPANFVAYEAIVCKAWETEQIVQQAKHLAEHPEELDTVLAALTASGGVSRWEYDQSAALEKAFTLLDKMQAGIAGVSTGFPHLDELTQGLMPGRLTVVGGRPSMGKTAFSTALALNAGCPVGFISSEMSVDQITLRILSMLSRVPLSSATRGMSAEEWTKWNRGVADLRETPLMINDRPGITIEEIARQSRKWTYNAGMKLLIIDYCQRLGGNPKKDRTENIRESVQQSKEIARNLDIHVVLLSQVNRGIEVRQDKRPLMSDLDGAGTIEAEADHVVNLYRPWVYDKSYSKSDVEVILAKNRHGPSPETVFAHFDAATTTFSPVEKRNEAPF
jgi:replicative DNA helicase